MSARFRKHCMPWFNFIIIIQVTNEVFIVFSPKEILLGTSAFSQYPHLLRK